MGTFLNYWNNSAEGERRTWERRGKRGHIFTLESMEYFLSGWPDSHTSYGCAATHECSVSGHITSSATLIARFNSAILPVSHAPISRTKRWRGTVRILSKFATHCMGNPCLRPSGTSVGSWRTVRVTRTTTMPPMLWRTASRVRITTGRLPTGEGSSAHQTSPRFTPRQPSNPRYPVVPQAMRPASQPLRLRRYQ